jgi:hypothetical protein
MSQGRQEPAMAKSTKRIAFGADQPSAFVTLIEDFRDFPQL